MGGLGSRPPLFIPAGGTQKWTLLDAGKRSRACKGIKDKDTDTVLVCRRFETLPLPPKRND